LLIMVRPHILKVQNRILQKLKIVWSDNHSNTGIPQLLYNPQFHTLSILIPVSSFVLKSDFHPQLMSRYLELSHSGTLKLSPELYVVSTKCQDDDTSGCAA
jgi:hypothetical protein